MKIVHISDTHGYRFHQNLVIPECDVLIHSGDYSDWIGTINDLTAFLIWFEAQPAKVKIFVAGNHDCILDKEWVNKRGDVVARMLANQQRMDALEIIQKYDVKYLNNTEYVYQGVKFWGSPYSPTFGHDWAFNADKGSKIQKIWAKIPSDVNVLITHTPVYGFLDTVTDKYMKEGETDYHKGCKDLLEVIKKRLFSLKLHCGGHIHDDVGVVLKHVSATRRVLFSNGAIIANDATQLITNPLTITL
jgi:Icc-related predicted phosphoesterase